MRLPRRAGVPDERAPTREDRPHPGVGRLLPKPRRPGDRQRRPAATLGSDAGRRGPWTVRNARAGAGAGRPAVGGSVGRALLGEGAPAGGAGSPMIRVFIVDDHGLARAGLRMILEAQADIEVVGVASDGA